MRTITNADLKDRTNRLRLDPRAKPYWMKIGRRGLALGYRRNENYGTWSVRSTRGGKQWIKKFAEADDFADANGETVLSFLDAQRKANDLAHVIRNEDGAESDRPLTVAEAIEEYRKHLELNGGAVYNATLAAKDLDQSILDKPVIMLNEKELSRHRDALKLAGRKAAAVNRSICPLKAALNLAAKKNPKQITNRAVWTAGLEPLKGRGEYKSHNVVLSDDEIRRIVEAAYAEDVAFGLLVSVAAETGGRYSQLARIEVRGLHPDALVMPSSKKGGPDAMKVASRRVPISRGLAARLQRTATGRRSGPLLLRGDGIAWEPGHTRLLWERTLKRAGLDRVTMYALRHSSITRLLLANVPIRVVADMHDTSVRMIELTYSENIASHADAVYRKGMIDLEPPPAAPTLALVA